MILTLDLSHDHLPVSFLSGVLVVNDPHTGPVSGSSSSTAYVKRGATQQGEM